MVCFRKFGDIKTIITLFLLIAGFVLLPNSPPAAGAEFAIDETLATEEHQILENLPFRVDGREPVIIKTLHYDYQNNRFVSIRDFAMALRGTSKHFQMRLDDGQVRTFTGEDYTPAGGEGQPFPEEYTDPSKAATFNTYQLALNPIMLDGRPVHYRSFFGNNPENHPDCFISLTDLAMQLDLNVTLENDGLCLETGESFVIDPDIIQRDEFYYEVHSALLGDAGTGEILVSKNADASVAVASTSKLMTYLVLMDRVREGTISLDDTVVIPKEAAALSRTDDGVIPMISGTEASVMDLLTGMLVPSSDECSSSGDLCCRQRRGICCVDAAESRRTALVGSDGVFQQPWTSALFR